MTVKHRTMRTVWIAGLGLALLACVALVGCGENFANAEKVVRAEEGQLTVVKHDGYTEQTHQVAVDAKVILDGEPAALEQLDEGDAVKLTTETMENGNQVVKKIEAKSKEAVETEKSIPSPVIDPPIAPYGPMGGVPINELPIKSADLNDSAPQGPLSGSDALIDPEEGSPQHADPLSSTPADAFPPEESYAGRITQLDDKQLVIKDPSDVELTFRVTDETKYMLDGKESTLDQLMVSYSVTIMGEMEGNDYVAQMVEATSSDSSQ